MPTVLDNQEAISALDTRDMLGAVERFPEVLRSQLQVSSQAGKRFRSSAFHNIVFMGMGGSASAGDVVVDWLGAKIRIPVIVHRDSAIPRSVGSSTLFVALSYSGETRETLAAFREARKRGSSLVAVGSGGNLKQLSEQFGVPFLEVQPAPAPRAALGQMIVGAAFSLYSHGVIQDPSIEIESASRELSRLRNHVRREVMFSENPAKRLAMTLKSRFLVIYAFQRMGSVARRFKNQLAENCKMLAKYDLLPEAGHNEVEAWSSQRLPVVPVFIRDHSESKFEQSVFRSFRATITKAGRTAPLQVRLQGRTRLGALLLPLLYLDFVSVYLAFLKGLDPSDAPWIRLFRSGV